MRFVEGTPDERNAETARRMDLHPRQVGLAVEFAGTHAEEMDRPIEENDLAARDAQAAAEARARYRRS